MRLFTELLKATFVSRPNRFIVQANLNGKLIEVYLSNPGRLQELLFEGVELLIQSTAESKGRMDWRAVGLLQGDLSVCLHTHAANDIAEYLINHNCIDSLSGWKVIKREQRVGRSRFDLLLEKDGEQRLGEVKSCTLFTSKAAMFPDAPSERAIKHLTELAELAPADGPKPLVLFIVQKQGLQGFAPDWHTDLQFAKTLLEVKDRLEIHAIGVLTDAEMNLSDQTEELPILWDLSQTEAHDQGAYLYMLHLAEDTSILIGALGEVQFPAGFYVYTGSAATNLTQRLARHQRKNKKHHWHIDYLRAKAEHHAALPVRSQDDLECSLAQSLAKLSDFQISNFGCSDCSCKSHLFGFSKDPLENRDFFTHLFHYRIDRHL